MSKIGVLHPSSSASEDTISGLPLADLIDPQRFEVCTDGLPPVASGLLIVGAEEREFPTFSHRTIGEALRRDLPILASGAGMHALNAALGGGEPIPSSHGDRDPSGSSRKTSTSIFLAPGAKTSSTIGGSGWLSIRCDHTLGIEQGALSPKLMASCISNDRFIEAFEIPGHSWVIGVQWDVKNAEKLPRGFDSILLAFLERAV